MFINEVVNNELLYWTVQVCQDFHFLSGPRLVFCWTTSCSPPPPLVSGTSLLISHWLFPPVLPPPLIRISPGARLFVCSQPTRQYWNYQTSWKAPFAWALEGLWVLTHLCMILARPWIPLISLSVFGFLDICVHTKRTFSGCLFHWHAPSTWHFQLLALLGQVSQKTTVCKLLIPVTISIFLFLNPPAIDLSLTPPRPAALLHLN